MKKSGHPIQGGKDGLPDFCIPRRPVLIAHAAVIGAPVAAVARLECLRPWLGRYSRTSPVAVSMMSHIAAGRRRYHHIRRLRWPARGKQMTQPASIRMASRGRGKCDRRRYSQQHSSHRRHPLLLAMSVLGVWRANCTSAILSARQEKTIAECVPNVCDSTFTAKCGRVLHQRDVIQDCRAPALLSNR